MKGVGKVKDGEAGIASGKNRRTIARPCAFTVGLSSIEHCAAWHWIERYP